MLRIDGQSASLYWYQGTIWHPGPVLSPSPYLYPPGTKNNKQTNKQTPWPLVRERTIPRWPNSILLLKTYRNGRLHCRAIVAFMSFVENLLLRPIVVVELLSSDWVEPLPSSEGTCYRSQWNMYRILHCKIWSFHGGDNEEFRLLECYAVWLL
jgi:hypothetical protein